MNRENYTKINSKIIDRWIDDGIVWGQPISHETFVKAQNGDWEVGLAFNIIPKDWFLPYINLHNNRLDGVKLLGLASGGGQQMPLFAANGADCTILDYSDRQLASEKLVAERENYQINIVKADMSKRFPFEDNYFDVIYHPLSNSYIEDVYHVWNECYRVLKYGGILLAGMDNGINFLFDDLYEENISEDTKLIAVNKMPFNPLNDPVLYDKMMEDDDGIEFGHTLDEQIGGQLKAGFLLTHLSESREPSGLIAQYFPQFISTRAIKPDLRT